MAQGGLVAAIAAGGLGERLGLRVGDRVLEVNGYPLRDLIDFRFYGGDEWVSLRVLRGGRELTLAGQRRHGQAWGVDFALPLFDGIRTCQNRCPFCFVSGLPAGLRRSLYVRDDDYRLSFLSGSFVTLTNLCEDDWQRLAEQRLSPLYVSVQATEPELRRRLFGRRSLPDVRAEIRRLGELGITVHAQVVVCPGLNDGPALEQTVSDLWELRGVVESVALVPVGVTRHHPVALKRVTPALATELLAWAEPWRRRACRESRRRFLYPADELYLLAGQPVPGARAYDGFPQLANGVGLVRQFLDGWRRAERALGSRVAPLASATLVSGTAFAPFLEPVAERLSQALGMRCRVRAVANRLFGETVTVAGLLGARDVVDQLRRGEPGDLVVLPRSMLDAAGERTLDDWTPARMASALGRRVVVAGSAEELVGALALPPGAPSA